MLQKTTRALFVSALFAAFAAGASAQSSVAPQNANPAATPAPPAQNHAAGGLFGFDEMRRQLREQREEMEELRAALKEQTRLMGELRARVEHAEQQAALGPAAVVREAAYARGAGESGGAARAPGGAEGAAGAAQNSELEKRVARVEEQSKKTGEVVAKQLGSLTFSGDLRLRYESFYGQQNALPSSDNPAALGNPLSTRQRLRLRARFNVRGKVTDEFEWGLRLATGTYPDMTSNNQTLTDFFTHKPFALDQAYITYKPKALPGFQVQAGKFDTPWVRTEMTWDNDISPEGLNESYTRAFKKSPVKSVALVAWQLPMIERGSAFVVGADGHVDLSASRRAGRDLALYGAQVRTEVAPSKNVSLKLSASDLYFSGTQFITPAQFFGANVQFPVTVNIPASGTTPARTVTTQVSIPRELFVAGSSLGLLPASTNATNRDGHLSSGYNLVDLIARADFSRSRRWPVMLLFNFVDNTQTHAVVVAGPAGADLALPNHEGQGFWAEFQVGKDLLRLPLDKITRGDVMLNYTFIRVERDAILSPFNGSDLGQSTDMRVNRFAVGYALDPHVQLTLTGFFTQRPNGQLGPFAQTPPGSLNRTLTRLQLDTILRF